MRLREWFRRLNLLQQSTPFKIVASVLIVALAIAAFASYFVYVTAPGTAPEAPPIPAEVSEADRSALESAQRIVTGLLSGQVLSIQFVAVGVAVLAGLWLLVIWLGLGLTYLGLLLVAAAVAYPLSLYEPTRETARLLGGLVALTASFTALMRGLRAAFSGPGPVLAIARNVLAEAVRMKISLVFIVLLIFGLAALPDLLNESSPLRYRVQSFLQYGTGGSFWIIAILVLFFAAATVAFEQRDRQIWQTMTKPVAPWQYILGKWLGVAGLAAVLLAVCSSAVFLFTEYLRQQPAQGEAAAIAAGITTPVEDRVILETQVLAARVAVEPDPPPEDPEGTAQEVNARIEAEKRQDPQFRDTPEVRARIAQEIREEEWQKYRSIEPAERAERYTFSGLGPARAANAPLIFRYRINAGSNRPDELYYLTFAFNGRPTEPQQVGLGYSHTLREPLLPTIIDDEGRLHVDVFSGDPTRGLLNPLTVTFPPGGLEISYSPASYRMNFLRVALVLWIKLALLAMIAITASTFLSFPVACLVSFAAFFAAESAGFLTESLQYYATVDEQGNIIWPKVFVHAIGSAVGWMFKTYADLRPTTTLVEGRLLSWSSVAWATAIIAVWTVALYGVAVAVFRRRELAVYSGQ